MARIATIYSCQSCGFTSQKWVGRCNGCGEWNTFVQEVVRSSGGSGAPGQSPGLGGSSAPRSLVSIDLAEHPRYPTGVGELDRVLGGGLVPGGLVLIGGDPGIGKSTLLLQVADQLARRHGPVLYATAEESDHQVRLRADRLGISSENLLLTAETDIGVILRHTAELRPACLIVDSIQAV
ncbi:MAG: AAA family ATPase, partial [Chloroflexi bacterium]|nr:AAA family ATPase [Chloroflexota bacterium]